LGVCNNELITTIKAAEQLDNLINLFLNIVHLHFFEGGLLRVVHEQCNVLRSLLEFVHESLETLITSLLESHVILEGSSYQVINFIFKCKKFLYKL
jgi:hypothetical protein